MPLSLFDPVLLPALQPTNARAKPAINAAPNNEVRMARNDRRVNRRLSEQKWRVLTQRLAENERTTCLRRVALDELEGAVDFQRKAAAAARDQPHVGALLLEATAQQDEAALDVVRERALHRRSSGSGLDAVEDGIVAEVGA